jgi:parvulin-like peptidyl-prolyl isomerase
MPDDLTPSQMKDSRSTNTEKPILKFTEEELKLALYELEGKPYSLQDFSDEYDRLHPYARPQKGARLQGIFNWAHKAVINELMPREAQITGLDQEPLFLLAMKEFEEQACIGVVRKVLVDQPIVLSDDQVRQWYMDNPSYYTLKPQVRVYQMANPEEEEIQKAYKRLLAGDDLHEVAKEHSVVPEHQMLTQPFHPDSLANPGNQPIAAIQLLAEVGDFTPPFENQGYWGIAQLNEKIEGRLMEFEEAYDRASTDLREMTSNARLDSLLDIWGEQHDIVIDEDVLGKAELDMGTLAFQTP